MQTLDRWVNERMLAADVIYASIDIRRGAGRICPVDVNLFPAGFNNLCRVDAEAVAPVFGEALKRRGVAPGAAVGIIAESHTRNPFYAEHLHALVGHIRRAGFRAEVSCPECAEDVVVRSSSGQTMTLLPIGGKEGRVVFGADFNPDFLLINNDLSTGVPLLLAAARQPMSPSPSRGWHVRRKHMFFEAYEKIVAEFCAIIGEDPRRYLPRSIRVADVDFKTRAGLEPVAAAVETVLAETRRWNEEHHVDEPPAAIIKSNYGTYGMAVMSVSSPDEVTQMNRKTINKMQIGKGKVQTTEVIVQEAIPTDDQIDGCPAEPVIYLIDGTPVGAFYRHHCERGNKYNLNVSGMSFEPICLKDRPTTGEIPAVLLISRLASYAASKETGTVLI